jgi:hypothetical protein
VIWTLLCLADDDPLCKAAIRLSGALPLLVPVLGLAPFSAPVNAYMGLPALAARALRVLGQGNSCKQEEDSLSPRGSNDAISSSVRGQARWYQTAVPHLARLLRSSEGMLHNCSKQRLHTLPRLSSLNSSQKTSKCGQISEPSFGLHAQPRILTLYYSPGYESSLAGCEGRAQVHQIHPNLNLHGGR